MAGNICFDIQEALNHVQEQAEAEITKRDNLIQRQAKHIEEQAAQLQELRAKAKTASESSGGTVLRAAQ